MTDTLIACEHVSKVFKSDWTFAPKTVVSDISFKVARGECFGFVGPNGAGKTTTIKMLVDIIRPSQGRVALFGSKPSDPAARARLGFLPERPYFYDYLTGREILTMYAELSGVRDVAKRVGEMLALVGLTEAASTALRRYSKGMLQRIGLAHALIGDPELVILDEPMSGLDPVGRRDVREIILEQRRRGKTVFFSSHILSDIEAICDRVAMIHKGRLVLEGSVEELVRRSGRDESVLTLRGAGTLPDALKHFAARPGDHLEGVVANAALQSAISAAIVAGFAVVSVQPKHGSLEDEMMRNIGEKLSAVGS